MTLPDISLYFPRLFAGGYINGIIDTQTTINHKYDYDGRQSKPALDVRIDLYALIVSYHKLLRSSAVSLTFMI